MRGRLFWEKRSLKKYRIVFESDEMIVGAGRKNKYRTFRKDAGLIAFSRREVLEMRIQDLTKRPQTEAESNEKGEFNSIGDPAFEFNFG
jgi:hypothetical protein